MLVPLAAGGGVDMMARLTAQPLSDQVGQQVVAENQGGAGGIAAETNKAMKHPDVTARLGTVGIGSSPQELDRCWHQQLDYLGKVGRDANIKPVE